MEDLNRVLYINLSTTLLHPSAPYESKKGYRERSEKIVIDIKRFKNSVDNIEGELNYLNDENEKKI